MLRKGMYVSKCVTGTCITSGKGEAARPGSMVKNESSNNNNSQLESGSMLSNKSVTLLAE